ncbi:hypothetical protein [Xanthocytophaga flava]|uniref:hypothetical protein n=1 Tax=Xanthocytophaga flava TaxID=3048013 RepID=UPI0028D544AC|nr:hypothetical protein [Xanthocytophaga flavus]MDJ1468830.1 hypothetical protein [Xanthocytophaga flavus]
MQFTFRLRKCVSVLLLFCPFLSVYAQCTYTSVAGGGNWSDPATWTITGSGCSTTPSSTSTVIIDSHVILDQNFAVLSAGSRHGSITINTGASLQESSTAQTLIFGDGTGSQRQRLEANGLLNVSNVVFDKSDALFTVHSTIKCNLTVNNQSTITIAGTQLTVEGNYNFINGNIASAGNGKLLIVGCVTGSNGFLNSSIIAPLIVCVLNQPTTCGTGTCNGDVPLNNDQNCMLMMPVDWLSFTTTYNEEKKYVVLQWETASEENNAYFMIEYSEDGINFTSIGQVMGAGSSTEKHTYSYMDSKPSYGTHYYRIRQVDDTNISSYSKVNTIRIFADNASLHIVSNGNGSYALQIYGAGNINQIQVFDLLGRIIYSDQSQALAESSYVERNIPLAFSSAVYTVSVVTDKGAFFRKVAVWNE